MASAVSIFQKVLDHLSSSHQAVIRQSSGSHQGIIGQFSSILVCDAVAVFHQVVISRLIGIRKSSDCVKPSSNCQSVVFLDAAYETEFPQLHSCKKAVGSIMPRSVKHNRLYIIQINPRFNIYHDIIIAIIDSDQAITRKPSFRSSLDDFNCVV